MRIKVQVKKIASSTNDWTKKASILFTNKACESISKELERTLKDSVCKEHGLDSKGTITIAPDPVTKKIKLKKSNFCCKEFEESIKLPKQT